MLLYIGIVMLSEGTPFEYYHVLQVGYLIIQMVDLKIRGSAMATKL